MQIGDLKVLKLVEIDDYVNVKTVFGTYCCRLRFNHPGLERSPNSQTSCFVIPAVVGGVVLDMHPHPEESAERASYKIPTTVDPLGTHPFGFIGRLSVQSKVPWSRSRTASFQPISSARDLKLRPSGECRVMPSNTVDKRCAAESPMASMA